MNDDDPIYDDDAPGIDRKLILIVLAGMTGLAVTLAILQSRMGKRRANIPFDQGWEASLMHVTDAFETRFAGIDNRINALARGQGAEAYILPVGTPPVQQQPPTAPQFVPGPPVAEHQDNGSVERIPPVLNITGADGAEVGAVSAPPGPAATSLP